MRCVVRSIILTILAFILLIYFAVSHANSKIVQAFDENDEEARRILDTAIPSQPAGNVQQTGNGVGKQNMSVSVALVLIVSLISVALLITGIIIIAVTLDPSSNNEEDDESDLEVDEPTTNSIQSKSKIADGCSQNGYYPRFEYDFNTSNNILTEL